MRIRQSDGKYVAQAREGASTTDGLPEWLEEFRTAAQADYVSERDSVEEGDIFTWPKKLENWDASDVSQWWENTEFGIRAIAVNTNELIVADLKAVDSRAASTSRPTPGRAACSS